ncbi:hypothetical protein MKW98_030524 [Papaver atlanticum]|uniref:Uncharacterized protein n=1 Tax=Papaver atlanticum TaxID=357466 RepID=A0AAD4XPW9_9MAGN|nr:hypothetical protein MKW98_030524 [Papaver atlanticum]
MLLRSTRGIADVKKREVGEGAILSLLNYSTEGGPSQTVMYSTQNCGIHLWYTRTNSMAWMLKATPEEGYVSSMVTGPCGNWVCPIENMCLLIPQPNTSMAATARPLVYVSAGCNEVSLWNAENGSCHQVLRLANSDGEGEMSDLPRALSRPTTKSKVSN